MKRKIFAVLMGLTLVTSTLVGCTSKVPEDETPKTTDVETQTNGLTEEESQMGKGVNGELPAPEYTYKGIVNAAVGICPTPHQKRGYGLQEWVDIKDQWRNNMKAEVDKIEKHLSAEATDEEIDYFFNQLLYIVASDYSAIEEINRFSYAIFKKDMQDPFTKEGIKENKNINVEIVLDASGSMANQINGQTMMAIAKTSIAEVLKQLPKNAKVGLRVFGHKGNNTDAGQAESCAANELIYPIETLNSAGITQALASVEPTGWTSIADSIKNGGEDLSKFKEEGAVNILYIITDGIETCGGDPVAAAQALKNKGTNVVLGIIGFNVNASQDALLKKIAEAGQGYYANANDAGTLTAELYTISEVANSLYDWEPLTETVCNVIKRNHNSALLYNKFAFSNTASDESSALMDASSYAERQGIISKEVYNKLKEKIKERKDKITTILQEEYAKREAESKQYLSALHARKGEEVAVVRMTSRVDPFSDYYVSTTGVGGSLEDAKKEGEKLNAEQEETMKNEQK